MRVPTVLEKYSVSPLEFLSRAGLSPNIFLQGAVWLPRDYCFTLVEKAVTMAGNPYFGAQVGSHIELTDLDAFGSRILAASTIGEALKIASHELGLIHRGAILRVEGTTGFESLHFRFEGRIDADPLQFELGTLAVLRTIALLAGQPDGVRMHLALNHSRSVPALEEFLGEKLEFGQKSNSIIIDRDLLDMPVTTPRLRGASDIASIIDCARLIIELLPEGSANLDTIARRMCVNKRTLQRRLGKFGITFEELVDITRSDEAKRLIAEGKDGLADIALGLGYSNQANFNRAFLRWTGLQPTGFRRTN